MTGKEAKRRYRSRVLRSGLLVRLHPDHGAKLHAVAEEAGLSLAWATTWRDEANELIGPAVGLPELPVVEFPADDLDATGDLPSWVSGGAWKYRGVAEFTNGKPVAWLDDEFGLRDHSSARDRFLADRSSAPTLLHNVSARTGITDADLKTVADWATSL